MGERRETRPCREFVTTRFCHWGQRCRFVHPSPDSQPARYHGPNLREEDLTQQAWIRCLGIGRAIPVDFKRTRCSLAASRDHSIDDCPDWHSPDDYIRPPYRGTSDLIDYAPDATINSWEIRFHPFLFRTLRCDSTKCMHRRQSFCSYFHTEEERRGRVQTTTQQLLQNPVNEDLGEATEIRPGFVYWESAVIARGSPGCVVYHGAILDEYGEAARIAVKSVVLQTEEQRERIRREIETLRQCNARHGQHIVGVRGLAEFVKTGVTTCCYLPLELMDGTLNCIHTHPAHNRIRWRHVGRILLAGLEFLHANRIYHRDIKPANILVKWMDDELVVKIGDVDRSKTVLEGHTYSASRSTRGTECWASRELDEDEADNLMLPYCDIFSMGMVFFYMVSGGRHPFDADNDRLICCHCDSKIARKLQAEINRGAVLNQPHQQLLPGEWRSLVLAMTRPDPVRRPTAVACLNHPLFMSAKQRRQKIMGLDSIEDLNLAVSVQMSFTRYIGLIDSNLQWCPWRTDEPGWTVGIEPLVAEVAAKSRGARPFEYDSQRASHLLHFCRNVLEHGFKPESEATRTILQPFRHRLEWLEHQFPALLHFVWELEPLYEQYLAVLEEQCRRQQASRRNLSDSESDGDELDEETEAEGEASTEAIDRLRLLEKAILRLANES